LTGDEIMPFLVIAAGGVLGANARYLVGLWAAERFGSTFPYGTFLVNVSGSLLVGFVLTLLTERFAIYPLWRLFFATGFLGAYTTFSAYTSETAELMRGGAWALALVYLVGTVAAGMVGVLVGIAAAERI
jgi:fluoride exporter